MTKIDMVWEMETGDPDDYITLLFLLGHSKVNLKAVMVSPGAPDQIGLVRHALKLMDRTEIPVGSFRPGYEKKCVSAWHYKAFGNIPSSNEVEEGYNILAKVLDNNTTMLTGSPPRNLGKIMTHLGNAFKLGRWVCQGGFAGEGVVPRELQLDKFAGQTICPTFNLNGAVKEVLGLLEHPGIQKKVFVSKNVCHGVVYDRSFHDKITPFKNKSRSLELIYNAMSIYLRDHNGKAFHDPLAACCAIDETIGVWREVEVYRQGGQWGSRLKEGNTKIIIDYDRDKFFNILVDA